VGGLLGGGDARGSVTAEFAAVLPAVMMVMVCCLGGLRVAGEQLQLEGTAAVAARAVSRGDAAPATAATLVRSDRGDLVCVTASTSANLGLLGGLTLTATSCALDH
jgi:Flp pilus assembly protein TadG